MILLLLAASLNAVNEFVGPPVVPDTLVSAAAAKIKSLAFVVAAVGVVGVVLTPALVAGATSSALLVTTPENSLTFTPPLPTAFAYVTVTELPVPVLFNPYQISTTEWLPPTLARPQLTPPPLTPLIDTLLLAENNTSALPGCGAAFRFTTTLDAAEYTAAFCCTSAVDPPPPPDGVTVSVAVLVPLL
jgi:hypothetical protein